MLERRGMPSFSLKLKPGQRVKKAIIPLAGFGTRVFPETKCVKKCFLPILDDDGLLKPALLIMLEQLVDSGIEKIALIIGDNEQAEFDAFFRPVNEEQLCVLPDNMKSCEDTIQTIREKVIFIHQSERKGFGHAVWLGKDFADHEPVLLLLGDFVYKSDNALNCCKQIIDAFSECGKTLVSMKEIELESVNNYGIIWGKWKDGTNLLNANLMYEKPTCSYAKENLGVEDPSGRVKYYSTFGQYVLTTSVFDELEEMIINGTPTEGNEYGLTAAINNVCRKDGVYGYIPEGKSYDIGLPNSYYRTFLEYATK